MGAQVACIYSCLNFIPSPAKRSSTGVYTEGISAGRGFALFDITKEAKCTMQGCLSLGVSISGFEEEGEENASAQADHEETENLEDSEDGAANQTRSGTLRRQATREEYQEEEGRRGDGCIRKGKSKRKKTRRRTGSS